MPSPFPGMDPYLENPALWPDVHHEIISDIRASLTSSLRPRYVARVELRIYISDDGDTGRKLFVPDVRVEETGKYRPLANIGGTMTIAEPMIITWLDDEVKEAYIEIKHVDSEKLVTVIEVVSPTNKIPGAYGRKSFTEKRREVLDSGVHWVEIDLLREGTLTVNNPSLVPSDYRVLVSNADDRNHARYWTIGLRQQLPVIGIPLRGKDADAPLDLNAMLKRVYERSAYELTIDYGKPPTPSLKGKDATWAKQLIRKQ